MKLHGLAAALLFGAAGCQSATGDDADGQKTADPLKATLSVEACPDIGNRAYFFWMEPRSAEPGDSLALFPYWTDMPGGYNDLPPGCVDDLGVYPEGAVTFSRQEDGLAIATISPDAEPGTRIRLDATYPDGHRLGGLVDVYRRADNPLVGTWRQKAEDCPNGSEAIQELVFTGSGEFSVTWTPFEVYKDYWGVYEYDAESNAFRIAIEGGNQVPEDIYEQGTVLIEGDELDFDQVFFGTPRQASEPCSANFVR